MSSNLQNTAMFILPTDAEVENEKVNFPDITMVHQRITDIIFVLGNFKSNRQGLFIYVFVSLIFRGKI